MGAIALESPVPPGRPELEEEERRPRLNVRVSPEVMAKIEEMAGPDPKRGEVTRIVEKALRKAFGLDEA